MQKIAILIGCLIFVLGGCAQTTVEMPCDGILGGQLRGSDDYEELLCQGKRQLQAGAPVDAAQSLEMVLGLRLHEVPNFEALPLLALAYWRSGAKDQARATLKEAELSLRVLVGEVRCIETADSKLCWRWSKSPPAPDQGPSSPLRQPLKRWNMPCADFCFWSLCVAAFGYATLQPTSFTVSTQAKGKMMTAAISTPNPPSASSTAADMPGRT